MKLQFLGAATTVTGSQFLLTTDQAKVLVDCGMFQGSPNESIRNRIPLAYDPAELDAILLTHAHLDHCGLIPYVVARGFKGPIYATAGTAELARLVLLDSGKLQQEFAKRQARFARRHPDKAAAEEKQQEARLEAAIELSGEDSAADDQHGDQAKMVPNEELMRADHWPALNHAAVTKGEAWMAPNPEVALRYQPPALEVELDEPLYDEHDAEDAVTHFKSVRYEAEVDVAPGIKAIFLDAGHILGSAIIRIHVTDSPGGAERQLVFSGDLGRHDTPIIRDPTHVSDADYVLMESTYGGREHEPGEEAVRILAETVRLVADHDGVLLVPSFAIGRTQEVVWQLDRLIAEGKIPQLPLYLDSPMASKASDVYRHHPEYFDETTRRLLEEQDSPLDYPGQIITNNVKESEAISRAKRPYMIVASNGMLTGGRVVGHLRDLIGDPTAVLLFVGYQGKGTMGDHLQQGAAQVRIDGQLQDVKCQVRSISGFSAHADESELLDWIGNFAANKRPGDTGFPRKVFIVHGDPAAQAALAPKVAALGFDVDIPKWHDVVTLD
ncbi:MAG: MBL fold metallo-hydrolase [Candidatus Limnocylindrales bacterium]